MLWVASNERIRNAIAGGCSCSHCRRCLSGV
nr:MAG TPA: Salt tolerance down-regulator [Caudoviricetes sp.]